MTDLFDRLYPVEGPVSNIPVHGFHAAISDYMVGETTRAQIIAVWSLDAEATADLDVLLATVDALTGIENKLRFVTELDAVMNLAELGLRYHTKSAFATRLGL
jgi:hypothetical protein